MAPPSSSLEAEVPEARCAVTRDLPPTLVVLEEERPKSDLPCKISLPDNDSTSWHQRFANRNGTDHQEQHLFGRVTEIQQIQDAFEHCCLGSASSRELFLISGESGCGKSSLVQTALKDRVTSSNHNGGCFLMGKFDQLQHEQPFAPFYQALNDWVSHWEMQIQTEGPNAIKLWLKEVGEHLKEELVVLQKTLVPSLSRLFPTILQQSAADTNITSTAMGREAQLERLKLALQRFLRAVCSPERPIVWVLDDCQWSSNTSLDLLEAMISISDTPGFMVVAICRREEVPFCHQFADLLRRLEDGNQETKVTHISVEPLSLEATNQLVSHHVQMLNSNLSSVACASLTQAIHEQTKGNVFYLHQTLLFLSNEGLMHQGSSSWGQQQHLGKSLQDLVSRNIQSLPSDCQGLLQTAAFLGGVEVETDILQRLLVDDGDNKQVDATLHKLVEEGLLIRKNSSLSNSSTYCFAHDQIQLGAYNLVPDDHRAMVHLEIGRALFQSLRPDDLKDHLFLVVNQMISGASLLQQRQDDKYGLATLCLRAGKQSTRSGDFCSAIYYFETGISLLSEFERSCWRDEYHLCLDLYSSLAEATCATAAFDKMDSAIDQVLVHSATRGSTISDTARVYTTRIYALSARLRPKEALALGREVVAKLGVELPAKPGIISFIRGIIKVKGKLSKHPDILDLPDIDPVDARHQIAAMTILSMMATCTYTADETDLYPSIGFAMIMISLKHGLSAMSSHGFCLLAVVLSAMDDHEGAHKYSQVALKIIDRFPGAKAEWLPRVSATIHGLPGFWHIPIADTFAPLLEAHAVGRDSGDIEFCVLAGHFHSLNSYVSGRNLADIEKSHAAYYHQMVELKHETWLSMAAIMLQHLRTLIGTTVDNPRMLEVDIPMDETHKTSYEMHSLFVTICQMTLSFHYDDLPLALDCCKRSRTAERTLKPSPILHVYYLYDGMTAFKAARTTKGRQRRKHIGRGRAMMKQFERLAKVCPENFLSSMYLLKAEFLDAKRTRREASVAAYSNAKDHAEKYGYKHIVAMAKESHGLATLRYGEIAAGKEILMGSVAAYRDWGALAIASYKEKEYCDEKGKNLVVRSWQ